MHAGTLSFETIDPRSSVWSGPRLIENLVIGDRNYKNCSRLNDRIPSYIMS
jgi:hypothetical protein